MCIRDRLDPIVKAKWAKYDRLKADYEQIAPQEDVYKRQILMRKIRLVYQ